MRKLVSVGALLFGLVPGALASEWESRVLYGGEIAFNYAPEDPGYFNQTEYTHDSLRLFRVSFDLELRAADWLSVLSEVRSDNLDAPKAYALYARVRPFTERVIDVQVGRIPPVFGAYSRRRYDSDNPLIGYPLPYQYPTSLRPDAAPSNVDQLLRYRGYGVLARYPIGDATTMEGLAQVNPLRWDTGVQVRIGSEPVELAVALTQGTISNPRLDDDNGGKQLAGRLGWRPAFGVGLGVSAARGDYVSDLVKSELAEGHDRSSQQTSLGVDAELSRGPWLVRAETIFTRWDVPTLPTLRSLDGLGYFVEGRYKIRAGLYVAARLSGSRFERIDRPRAPGGSVSWDAPVTRIEAGLGYALHRHVHLKLALQHNERDGGSERSRTIPAVQLLFWF